MLIIMICPSVTQKNELPRISIRAPFPERQITDGR
jgi:hypothetical protein